MLLVRRATATGTGRAGRSARAQWQAWGQGAEGVGGYARAGGAELGGEDPADEATEADAEAAAGPGPARGAELSPPTCIVTPVDARRFACA